MDRIIHIFSVIMFIHVYVLLFSILNIVRGEENVALGKTTSQSSTFGTSFSSLAVDGNTDNLSEQGSCSHTDDNVTNWWCVDLQRAVDFQNIKIYNRNTRQERLQGFEIRLSSNGECNDNGYLQSTVCYKDTSTTTQDIYTIEQCNQPNTGQFNGRSVYISVEHTTNSDKLLTLCEVEIYEKCPGNCKDGCNTKGVCNSCISGYYGDKCDKSCTTNCNGLCVQSTGDCLTCKDGYWEAQCSEQCPTNCIQSKCNKNNGHCISCKNKYWGEKCNKECSPNCKYNHYTTCYKTSGRCNSGCKETWYGDTCSNKCSSNCKHSNCYQSQSGLTCTDGCIDGYKGTYCTSCKTEWYVDICQTKCNGNCINGCDQFKGDCVNDKLDPGSPNGISQLASGIIGALSVIVIILLMVIFYCSYKRRIDRAKSNERPVRYTSGNEETVTSPQNEVTENSYDSNLPHDIPSSPYYNLQQVVDTSRVEANAYDSLNRTLPSPTYETFQ